MTRLESFGQTWEPTLVDRFGVALSARAVHRHASPSGQRVADLGCGYQATLARTFAGDARQVTLVDVSLADDLKRLENVTVIEGQLPEALAGVDTASFDLVLCLSVLEHVWEPDRLLGEIHRILVPGGTALLNVPTWLGKWFLELAAFRLGVSPAEEMDDHKRYYDPRDLWPLLVAAGFKPSAVQCRRHKFGLNTFAVCRKSGAGAEHGRR